jgi:hypothetical protein
LQGFGFSSPQSLQSQRPPHPKNRLPLNRLGACSRTTKSDIAEICHVIGAATRLLAEEPAALGSRPPVIRRADLGDKEILLAGRPDYRVALLRSGQPVLCLYFQVSSDQHPQINEQTAPGLLPGRREVER